ncbi:MAG: hypothetical protein IM650_09300 [Phenylobacterium sp.]|uniref:hypothetical protein n=1 Tax=Phenylobacterium sp. TaxID=1871053 RepID=UPI0025D1AAA0|nr:hypothetical protein [Phenylobacterium sp.]MCA3513816.1 hypothetical protein [Rhodobacter sp.]MCA6226655.1 hypothetical protein [Phenylobacterium sp.]MCA6231639.1 hypothetical protein [Phenylobacterium sp.]MCA6249334.1 hypothetical protein [Phenylobacterium sp.]MCA6258274.1 hypothetical protein [Phenylobacterium sp.]
MSQLGLFETSRAEYAPPPVNPDFVRKHLRRILNLAREAERLPWSAAETESWEDLFPKLAESLPPEEGGIMCEAFAAELKRLKGE